MDETIDVGCVHVLEAKGGSCVAHCPHPGHAHPSSAVGPAPDWMPPRSGAYPQVTAAEVDQ
jgi:hypothetical protein